MRLVYRESTRFQLWDEDRDGHQQRLVRDNESKS